MTKTVNECCGCRDVGIPCRGIDCPNRSVPRLFCDDCGEMRESLFLVDNDELCEDCAKDRLHTEGAFACDQCGETECDLFEYEGDVLCWCCLEDKLEEITE